MHEGAIYWNGKSEDTWGGNGGFKYWQFLICLRDIEGEMLRKWDIGVWSLGPEITEEIFAGCRWFFQFSGNGWNHSGNAYREKIKGAQDFILRSFITYMLANAVEVGGRAMWYCGVREREASRGWGLVRHTECHWERQKRKVTRSLGLLGTVLIYACCSNTVIIKNVLVCRLIT